MMVIGMINGDEKHSGRSTPWAAFKVSAHHMYLEKFDFRNWSVSDCLFILRLFYWRSHSKSWLLFCPVFINVCV